MLIIISDASKVEWLRPSESEHKCSSLASNGKEQCDPSRKIDKIKGRKQTRRTASSPAFSVFLLPFPYAEHMLMSGMNSESGLFRVRRLHLQIERKSSQKEKRALLKISLKICICLPKKGKLLWGLHIQKMEEGKLFSPKRKVNETFMVRWHILTTLTRTCMQYVNSESSLLILDYLIISEGCGLLALFILAVNIYIYENKCHSLCFCLPHSLFFWVYTVRMVVHCSLEIKSCTIQCVWECVCTVA